jgi:hypothetical protein
MPPMPLTEKQQLQKDRLIRQVFRERKERIHRKQLKEKEALKLRTEKTFARFLKRIDTELISVRKEVNGLPIEVYDLAFSISEGNRSDRAATTIRFIFRAIEVTPDMNWNKDIKRMKERLKALKEEERQRNLLNKKAKSNNYEHRTSPKQEQKKRHIGPGRSIAGSPPMAVQQL